MKLQLMFIGCAILFTAVFMAGLLVVPSLVHAQGPALPFGGTILTVTPCDGAIWITVGPPIPGSFIILPPPATFIHLYYALHPAADTAGLYIPGATIPCVVGVVPVGGGFEVIRLGTSL